ncbi:unnamed protein product [Penicillium olsonii]|uniref:DNA repair protein rhp7 treble clef domain-containing protein n=1 Tax=Penicillium olsonii TaxID=99116 RepID=A0A9W4IJJ2_PENOL|nr:unnamed protein product [Penicillium olsonii]CAG8295530.1 unnamed protein product [Penicillium olsonii]
MYGSPLREIHLIDTSYRANRRQARGIRGPRSALTDFLASNNISAQQIQDDYANRQAEAARQANEAQRQSVDPGAEQRRSPSEANSPEDLIKKRKRQQAITRIKNSKEFAKRKARLSGDHDPEYDDESLANQIHEERQRPQPGQLANCEICEKRFTVTPYSKTGPGGGLLCPDCSKKHKADEKKPPAKKRATGNIGRRQNQTNLLDGLTPHGTQSLLETCIKKVADYIHDVEDFGDLPPSLLLRLGQILSRRRAVTPKTLDLFIRPQYRSIDLFDCAKLDTDDFHKILASMPHLTRVNLRFTTPFKDEIIQYMVDRDMQIKDLHLDGANLVTDACWRHLFQKLGHRLQSLKLWNLNSAFDDETAQVMCKQCPNLQRLKLKFLHKTGNGTLEAISSLPFLEHLSLHYLKETEIDPKHLWSIMSAVGSRLKTLSLEEFELVDDKLLQLIHEQCHSLTKLRLSKNFTFTDAGLAALFVNWPNQALTYVDMNSLRDVDMTNPNGPEQPIGLASSAFVALMEHSGAKLQHLNIASCRHIPYQAFEQVFAEGKVYPELKYLDLSFSPAVDDYIAMCIFRCCPALQRLVVFACFKIRDIHIPRGLAVIGTVGATVKIDGVAQTETI